MEKGGESVRRFIEELKDFSKKGDMVLLILCLIVAGFGVIWLKVLLAVLVLLLSGLCLGFLYLSRELLRQRSLWMSMAAAAIGLCLLISLLLNFPSPNKYKNAADMPSDTLSVKCEYML